MGFEINVRFPGNKKVDAEFGGFVVQTDQPEQSGGDGSAPSPYQLFLASIATCAGIYVLGFCQARNLPTAGLGVREWLEHDASGALTKIGLEVIVPPTIPEKYHEALVRSAELCAVKKTIAHPPAFEVKAVVRG